MPVTISTRHQLNTSEKLKEFTSENDIEDIALLIVYVRM